MTDPTSYEGGERPATRDRKRDVRLVLSGVAAALLLWFALVNLTKVSITFWVSTTKAPLIVVIVISGVLGAVLALLLSRMSRRRRQPEQEPG